MPEKRPEPLREDYQVSTGDVFISVDYGFAQIGAGIIKLDGQKIADAPISKFRIGSGSELKSKTLLVKSIVADASETTNKVSAFYRLTGGMADKDSLSEGEVETDGDPMPFWAFFKFV